MSNEQWEWSNVAIEFSKCPLIIDHCSLLIALPNGKLEGGADDTAEGF
jgi:hypothetical protein